MFDESQMSLRFRLIALVCFVLVVSLALGGLIAYSNASRSVRTEMRAALLVGRQTIETAIERVEGSGDLMRELDDLVASFKGNRHLRVRLGGKAATFAAPAVERSALGAVPAWFVGLIGVPPETERVPVVVGGRDYGAIVLETDPYNETLEVWNEFSESLMTLTMFGGLTMILIYIFIGRTLRPLNRLADALEEIGDGHYRTRVSGRLTPELSRLRDSFNRMAARLAETDAENRRLNEQLLSLQEEERGELARDLHDEMGPYLFAIGVDAMTASRLLNETRGSEAAEHIQSITEAVRHMQRRVRHMLGRLRPVGLAEFGLREAIENLAAFWRRRRPEICFQAAISPECEELGDLASTTICRVVQEALSNAVRHAEPKLVTISIDRNGDEIRVAVADDGRGMREPGRLGYGLIGVSERVRAVGGQLRFSNRFGEGFAVIAVLPHRRVQDPLSTATAEATGP
jgi:two-component system, NarL family, sensor histidine kinase UhpB